MVVSQAGSGPSLLEPSNQPYIIDFMGPLLRSPAAPLAVIFDGDDTLWSTEELYDDARSRARQIVATCGLDGARWEERERLIDVRNVASMGYRMDRFPTSCIQAYEEMCVDAGWVVDTTTTLRIRQVAYSVFDRDPTLVVGAAETLERLRAKGVRLALLTKGDHGVQTRRIDRSGLRDWFDIVRIVDEKSPEIIRALVAALEVDVRSAWMVGNSMRSDIFPALHAGLRAVRIPAHVWELERSHDHLAAAGVLVAQELADVASLISV